jgi:hypothetical protein
MQLESLGSINEAVADAVPKAQDAMPGGARGGRWGWTGGGGRDGEGFRNEG